MGTYYRLSPAARPWEKYMCGIVAAVAGRDIVPLLIEGLQRLEYRGFDSAGIAVVNVSIKREIGRAHG